jgi:hypothetical protein
MKLIEVVRTVSRSRAMILLIGRPVNILNRLQVKDERLHKVKWILRLFAPSTSAHLHAETLQGA